MSRASAVKVVRLSGPFTQADLSAIAELLLRISQRHAPDGPFKLELDGQPRQSAEQWLYMHAEEEITPPKPCNTLCARFPDCPCSREV